MSNSEEKIMQMLGKKSALTEDAINYIARKTHQPKNIVRQFLETLMEFAALCLLKDGKVRILGLVTLILNKKPDDSIHIKAKAPQRLYNKVEEMKNSDIKLEETKIDAIVNEITYME